MKINEPLVKEIQREFEELNNMEVGTETYKTTVEGVSKLIDRAIELEKVKSEVNDRAESRELDRSLKVLQMSDEQKDRFIKNTISVVGIVIPTAVTIWGTLKTFKFEEEGTVTTMVGRGFINKLLPKK